MYQLPRLVTVLMAGAVLVGCAQADVGESATPSAMSQMPSAAEPDTSPSVSLDPTPIPMPTDAPMAGAWHGLSQFAPYGAVATVIVDRLRVRSGAGLSLPSAQSGDEEDFILTKGDQVLVMGGPMDVDGYRWYSVEFDAGDDDYLPVGWIAGAEVEPGHEPAQDGWLIAMGEPTCPESTGFRQVRVMTDFAMDVCDTELTTVRGMIDTCYEGPLSPWTPSPDWAWFSCYYVREETPDWVSSSWSYSVYFPPDFGDDLPERGDVVVLSGSLGVGEWRYGPCVVQNNAPDEPSLQVMQPTVEFSFAQRCRHHFVVSSMTKKRHVELEPMF
jgi:hypothetical protein